MLGLRFSRLVHAAIASGALMLAACQDGGKGDSDTDGETTTTTGETTAPTSGPPGTTLSPPLPPAPPVPPVPPVPPPPPVDTTPPALVSAVLLDPSTLQLSFTEPIAPVDLVNPKRLRFSFVQAFTGYYGDPITFVVDPRFYNGAVSCPPAPPCYDPYDYYCYDPYCYDEPSAPILAAKLVNHDSDPNSVLVALTTAIQPSLCQTLESAGQSPEIEAVLHLHYAAGGLAQLTDLAGVPLPALADDWVKTSDYYLVYDDVFLTNLDPFVPIPCPFF